MLFIMWEALSTQQNLVENYGSYMDSFSQQASIKGLLYIENKEYRFTDLIKIQSLTLKKKIILRFSFYKHTWMLLENRYYITQHAFASLFIVIKHRA